MKHKLFLSLVILLGAGGVSWSQFNRQLVNAVHSPQPGPLAILDNRTTIPRAPLPNAIASKILVDKTSRRMDLLNEEGQVIKSYKIALGNPTGHKTREGDRKTPEGIYKIAGRNPKSAYHLSLRISYPNQQDTAQAKARGVSPGGDIMIHGLPNGMGWTGAAHTMRDWTNGCIAVTDEEIEEIWQTVPDGTVIEIKA